MKVKGADQKTSFVISAEAHASLDVLSVLPSLVCFFCLLVFYNGLY